MRVVVLGVRGARLRLDVCVWQRWSLDLRGKWGYPAEFPPPVMHEE